MRWLAKPSEILIPVAKLALALYRWIISPLIHTLAGPGFGCRFQPTCSEYSRQAIDHFGLSKGVWLSIRRISRCHPFGGSGYDPLPVISPLSNESKLTIEINPELHPKCREAHQR